jgi:hypothetical protein
MLSKDRYIVMFFWRTSPPDTTYTYALFVWLNPFTAQRELQVRSSPGFPLLHLRGIGEFPAGTTKLGECESKRYPLGPLQTDIRVPGVASRSAPRCAFTRAWTKNT